MRQYCFNSYDEYWNNNYCFLVEAAKKFHEHIRRVAQGKIGDEQKLKNKKANRKSRVRINCRLNI